MKRRGFLKRVFGGVVAVSVAPSIDLVPVVAPVLAPIRPPIFNPTRALSVIPTSICVSMTTWLPPDEPRRDS